MALDLGGVSSSPTLGVKIALKNRILKNEDNFIICFSERLSNPFKTKLSSRVGIYVLFIFVHCVTFIKS